MAERTHITILSRMVRVRLETVTAKTWRSSWSWPDECLETASDGVPCLRAETGQWGRKAILKTLHSGWSTESLEGLCKGRILPNLCVDSWENARRIQGNQNAGPGEKRCGLARMVGLSVQFSSVPQSCPTLCDPMDCSRPELPVNHQLLEFTQARVHQVGDAIQPSHPLSSPSPPALNLSQHQGLSKWVTSHEVAKVLEFKLQHQSFQWIFRPDFL